MDIKITKKDSFQYTGIVTISLMQGNTTLKSVTVHNNGTLDFFHILCGAVIGNNVAYLMPKYLAVFDGTGRELSLARPHYTTAVVENTNEAVFTFVIPGSFLSAGTVRHLQLFNSSSLSANVLAEVFLSEENGVLTNTAANLMIQWRMSFTNASTSDAGEVS